MTPHFITPCYGYVGDRNKRKEVCEHLERIGYFICRCALFEGNGYLSASFVERSTPKSSRCEIHGIPSAVSELGYSIVLVRLDNEAEIDCGTNTELFLALASMRSDTDKGQWFVYGTDDPRYSCRDWDWYLCDKHDLKNDDPYLRKATAAEITEHLKTKTI